MAKMRQEAKVQGGIVKEPTAVYARNTEIPIFFGEPMLRGMFTQVALEVMDPDTPTLFYSHPNGEIWV